MSPQSKSIHRLQAFVNNYSWGKHGEKSLVAQLAPNAVGPSFHVDASRPYSELWVGTHPNGPSSLFSSHTPLLDLLTANPALLGPARQKWPDSAHLPYLFKVLSIASALPLQTHPDLQRAQRLHLHDPKAFVDANHKPEIAVSVGAPGSVEYVPGLPTLSDEVKPEDVAFSGFVGFMPLPDIAAALHATPELRKAIANTELVNAFVAYPAENTLKDVYSALVGRGAHVADDVRAYIKRVEGAKAEGREGAYATLAKKVDAQYSGDVGVFATVFFMNYVQLRPGQAIYIAADEVHAYLEGDIIECMATSDNVLNAAFPTPAAAEVREFAQALSYTTAPLSRYSLPFSPLSGTEHTTAYRPPLEEFAVLHTALAKDEEDRFDAVGPVAGVVLHGKVSVSVDGEGEGEQASFSYEKGSVLFVGPGKEIRVSAAGGQGAEVWWAACFV